MCNIIVVYIQIVILYLYRYVHYSRDSLDLQQSLVLSFELNEWVICVNL